MGEIGVWICGLRLGLGLGLFVQLLPGGDDDEVHVAGQELPGEDMGPELVAEHRVLLQGVQDVLEGVDGGVMAGSPAGWGLILSPWRRQRAWTAARTVAMEGRALGWSWGAARGGESGGREAHPRVPALGRRTAPGGLWRLGWWGRSFFRPSCPLGASWGPVEPAPREVWARLSGFRR